MPIMQCEKCYGYRNLGPKLVQSGYPSPENWKCPVCGTRYNSEGILSEEVYRIEEEERSKNIMYRKYRME